MNYAIGTSAMLFFGIVYLLSSVRMAKKYGLSILCVIKFILGASLCLFGKQILRFLMIYMDSVAGALIIATFLIIFLTINKFKKND